MTTLVMLGILLFGIMGYRQLPVSDLPNVDFPTVSVTANLPGASAETMASAVATPLERQFSSIDGLDSMSSVSSLGNTAITLQFNLRRKINDVPPDILAAINQATPLLPPGMPQPPSFKKVNPADQPILYLALTSPTLPLYQLDQYGETMMAERISMVSGVAQVNVFGSQKYAVHVQLDPDALASRNIGIDQVENSIRAANVNAPLGTLYGKTKAFTIQATGQLLTAAPYRNIIVAYRNGSPVRLGELGQTLDGVEDNKTAAWYVDHSSNQRSLILAIQRQPGANTVEVSDAIKALIPKFETYLPPSVHLRILYDRAESIRSSVKDVKYTILIALVLVILVIFLFLRNLSATIIPSLALPLSLIGTFAVMYLLGYTMDNLSLMAMTLGIGFVVDDAIVVLENIVRHMEHGEKPFEAALKGSQEIGFTIVSMTLSLAAVFIPLLFMGGIVGRLFREFSVTIFVAILLSGFISLTLTPMLCSRFLRPPRPKGEHSRLYNAMERVFDWMLHHYERSLQWALHHRRIMMLSFLVTLLATGYLLVKIPKGFIPDEDTSQAFGVIEAAQGTSFDAMVQNQKIVANILQNDPNIAEFYSGVGGPGAAALGGQNYGRLFFHLVPRSERNLDVYGVIREMQAKLTGLPGLRIFFQNPPTIRIGGQFTKSLYQFSLQSPNLDDLYKYAPMLEAKLRSLPELEGVTSDLQIKNPQATVVIDRDKSSTLGVDVQTIENALFDAYGTRWISTIYAPEDQFKVLIELEPQFQRHPNAMSRLYVTSSTGQLVPLDGLGQVKETVGPQAVSHVGQFSSVTLSFNVKQGIALSEVVNKVQDAGRQILPATITASFQGTAQAFQSSIAGLGLLLVVAILVIYLVLGILYESFVHPITILSGLPSAGFGALVTLLIFRVDLNVYSFVGLILLIGIVKKNAIMQIDFALEAQRREGKAPLDAIFQGCLIRFRPIMMTTLSALMAALPIAVGDSARRPLGLAVVGGLLFSQLVTLYLTPIFYIYMDAFQRHMREWLQRHRLMPAPKTKNMPVTVETY
ncbi:MAG: acriflavin resistance protein [Pedosphaera sp.]|nr:acriflavin resistance protein [Pedosphaera sp.]